MMLDAPLAPDLDADADRPPRLRTRRPASRSSTATCIRRCARSPTSSPTCRRAGASTCETYGSRRKLGMSYEPYPKSRAARLPARCLARGRRHSRARDLDLIRAQYLDAYGIEFGILGPLGVSGQSELNSEFSRRPHLRRQRLAARFLHQARAAPAGRPSSCRTRTRKPRSRRSSAAPTIRPTRRCSC